MSVTLESLSTELSFNSANAKISIVFDEISIQKKWNDDDIFKKSLFLNKSEDKDNYYEFYDGPPFATGSPHYGHVLAGSIKDTVARYQTQNGKIVPRRFGWDCHGLPIEYVIEKKHNIKNKKQIEEEWGIPKYNNACSEIVMTCASEWEIIMNRLARWVDFKNDYKTMDFDYMNSVWRVFSELAKKGLVYSSYRVMPYSVSCTTPLSNFETQQNYKEVDDTAIFVNFALAEYFNNKQVSLLVWTTTPWTLPSNLAIAINSKIEYSLIESNDEYLIMATNLLEKVFGMVKRKYKIIITNIDTSFLIGLKYIPPFGSYPLDTLKDHSKAFIIISADFITDTDGTGIVHIAPSFGEDDYQTCITNQIISKTDQLFMSIDEEGFFIRDLPTLEDLSGVFYKNSDFSKSKDIIIDGNSMIIKKLKGCNNLFWQYRYRHSYPFCWRSDTPLMYRAIKTWFVNVEVLKDRMVELNKDINWIPENVGSNRFHQWLSQAKDWCIARSRYWGTPIPIFTNINDPIDYKIVSSARELEKLCGLELGNIKNLHRDHVDMLTFEYNGSTYKRIPDVFDCWFESGSMPYASIGYPYKDNITDNPVFVADFIAEGVDQTRGWFYTMLIISTALFDRAPFRNVVVNGLVLAYDGKKMSKRLQNYPDVENVIEKYGADALRLYLLGSPASKGEDLKFNEDGVLLMVREIIITMKNALGFMEEHKKSLNIQFPGVELLTSDNYNTMNSLDAYAIHYIGKHICEINQDLSKYLLSDAVKKIIILVKMFTNQFLKFNRFSLKGKNGFEPWINSLSTMKILLNYMAVNIAPLMPYFSEYMFTKLENYNKSIHLIRFDEVKLPILDEEKIKMASDMRHVFDVIDLLLMIRQKNDISIKVPLERFLLKSTPEICRIIKENCNLILDELNVIELETFPFDNSDIKISIRNINFQNIKNVYPVKMKTVVNILNNLDKEHLNILAVKNQSLQVEEFVITSNMANFIIEPVKMPDYKSEYIYANSTNYCAYLYSAPMSENIKEMIYGKVIATSFQRMRREAGLKEWNPVILACFGDSEYDLKNNNIIRNKIFEICGHVLEVYDFICYSNIICKAQLCQTDSELISAIITEDGKRKELCKSHLLKKCVTDNKNLELYLINV